MTTRKNWLKVWALLLTLCMLFSAVGCNESGSDSDVSVNYGDDVYIDDDDDFVEDGDGTTTVTTTQQGNAGSGSGGQGTSGGNVGSVKGHEINEQAKSDFLKSVPKKFSGTTVKILVFWKPGDAEKAKMEKFTEATGIKIQWITETGDYLQKLSALKIQGNAPDLASIRNSDYPMVIMQDYFEPLSYGKLDYSDTSVYDTTVMNQYAWDGKVYGAAIKGSSMMPFNVLYYNTEMFSKVGMKTPRQLWEAGNWNWDTFRSMCIEAKSKMKTTAAVTCEYFGHMLVPTANTSYTKISNGKLVNNMNDPNLLKGWSFVNELQEIDKVLDVGMNRGSWIEQKCPMFIDGNYYLQKGDYFEKNDKFKYDNVPLPSPARQQLAVGSTLQLWGFPKGSKNAEAAAYVLRYWWDSAFDEAGNERWIDEKAKEFNNWLWEQHKVFECDGIVAYDGSYTNTEMYGELSSAGAANVRSVLDRWSGVITANINAVEKEFGKK